MKSRNILPLVILLITSIAQAAFINDPAPAFSLKDRAGGETSLKEFQGSVVFVNFWASWCPPCKQEFPELNELASEYKGQGVHVLAINLDKSADRVEKFLTKVNATPKDIKILMDPDAKVVADYVARSMPSSFIIDKKGVIRFVHFGYSEKDPAKWRQEIDMLLSGDKKK